MRAEVISVGTEITTGDVLNTNSYFISQKLFEIGIEVFYHTSVDDNLERLKNSYRAALDRSDLIIVTGGLGPTEDDFTKELMAKVLGLSLYYDKDYEKVIYEKFKGRPIPENNFKQSWNIEGGKLIRNKFGTAPGIYLKWKDKKIILLPGPPREMEPMFIEELLDLLKEDDYSIITKSINITGLGESYIELEIRDLINMYDDIEIATFGKIKNVQIRIIARGYDRQDLNSKIAYISKEISRRFKTNIYSYDNESIEEVTFNILKKEKLKISFAESCTGGLVSGRFVRMPGVSEVFDRSFVTYSNEAKMEELSVSKETLDKYGAVSRQTCKEMAEGLIKNTRADIALAITGIVGPKSDNTNKPLGLVYIGASNGINTLVREYNFKGDRKNMQDRIVENSYFLLREFLLKNID